MKRKTLRVGIMSRADYTQRTIAIAKGEYKPRKNEPTVWFESVQSMAQTLNTDNQNLLKLIIEHQPRSLVELEQLSDRKKSNLSRTLTTLARYGIVSLEKQNKNLVPTAHFTDFFVEFGLNYSHPIAS